MDAATEDFLRYRRRGRPADLARVFDAVAQELLLVASHLATAGVQPEDLVQATFLEAIEDAARFDADRPLRPWLIGILTNQARSARRRVRRRPDPARLPVAEVSDPSVAAEDTEFVEALHRAIADMPDPYREVLTLRFVHGLTPTQIAHALGHPPGTVKSWIHRGLGKLRELLPVGFAASIATLVRAADELSGVRREVLRVAAHRAPLFSAPLVGLAAVATLLLGAAGWFWWTGGRPAVGPGPESLAASAAAEPDEVDPPSGSARMAASLAPGLHLRTVAGDRKPLSAGVYLRPRWGADPELRSRWVTTDDAGQAHVPGLEAGDWDACLDRGGGGPRSRGHGFTRRARAARPERAAARGDRRSPLRRTRRPSGSLADHGRNP